jgi:hypothetical protein
VAGSFDPSDIRRHVRQYLLRGDRDEAFRALSEMAMGFSKRLFVPCDTKVDGLARKESRKFDTVSSALLAELHRWEGESTTTIEAAIASGTFDYLLKRIRDRIKNAITSFQRRGADFCDLDVLDAYRLKYRNETAPSLVELQVERLLAADADYTRAQGAAQLLENAACHVVDDRDAEDLLLGLWGQLEDRHSRILRMRKKRRKRVTRKR